ncbi:MAG: LysM peptidoglycan-binding domain-containing protein [Ornithinimicrobium sp.]
MSPMPADMPPVSISTDVAAHGPISAGPAHLLATLRSGDYVVKPGDTVYDIAATHRTSVSALVSANSLRDGGRWIMPGQRLHLSAGAKAGSSSSATSTKSSRTKAGAKASSPSTVTVRPGDTLSGIAAKYKVSVASLARANSITNTRLIYPGQRLVIDASASSSGSTSAKSTSAKASTSTSSSSKTSAKSPTSVTVRSGDTLSGIAAKYGVSLAALQAANPDVEPRRLWVGTSVRLPGTGTISAASARKTTKTSSRSTSPRTSPYTPDNIGDHLTDTDVDDTFLHYTYSSAVARSAAANRQYLASVPVPSTAATKDMIVATARRHGVDPKLMLALSYQESGWNQRAVSPANAIGTMQVIPTSGDWASSLVGRKLNLLDPQDNITAGTVIMRALQRSADNEIEAIGGYYQGLGSVNKYGLFSDTKSYVSSITALRARM